MTTLIVRPYAGEADLETIAQLCNICAAADRIDYYYSVNRLRANFTDPGFDPERDLRLWEDADGQLIALGELWIPKESGQTAKGYLSYWVHPKQRDRSLEFEILAWAEVRIRNIAQHKGLPAKLYLGCRDHQLDRLSLFEKCGFAYERCFLRMTRSLQEPIPQPQFPTGFTLAHTRGIADAAAWVQTYNDSFIDHWNHHPATVEEHSHWLTALDYRAEMDLVAIAPDGQFAAFCFCNIDLENNRQRHCQEGWVSILGTRRGFRRMGLGRAMLLAGLQKLQAEGMKTALLGVDTENANQAQSLYESAGFQKLHAHLSYAKFC